MAEPLVEGQLTGFVGWWRIVEMELWDADVIDLVAPAFIEFGKDLSGRFGFVVVDGWMDCCRLPVMRAAYRRRIGHS